MYRIKLLEKVCVAILYICIFITLLYLVMNTNTNPELHHRNTNRSHALSIQGNVIFFLLKPCNSIYIQPEYNKTTLSSNLALRLRYYCEVSICCHLMDKLLQIANCLWACCLACKHVCSSYHNRIPFYLLDRSNALTGIRFCNLSMT